MPLAPLSVLTALLHAYIALRLTPALMQTGAGWALLPVGLAVSALCMPLPFLQRPWLRSRAGHWAQWVGLLAMGAFSTLLLLTLLFVCPWMLLVTSTSKLVTRLCSVTV